MQPKKVRRDEKVPYSDADMHPDLMEFISTKVSNSLSALRNKSVLLKTKVNQEVHNITKILTKSLEITGKFKAQEITTDHATLDVADINKANITEITSHFKAMEGEIRKLNSDLVSTKVINTTTICSDGSTFQSSGIVNARVKNLVVENVAIGETIIKNGVANVIKSGTVLANHIASGYGYIRRMTKTSFDLVGAKYLYSKRIKANKITSNISISEYTESKRIIADKLESQTIRSCQVDSLYAEILKLKVTDINGNDFNELVGKSKVIESNGLHEFTLQMYQETIKDLYTRLAEANQNIESLYKYNRVLSEKLAEHIESRFMQTPTFRDKLDMLKNTKAGCIGTIAGGLYYNNGRSIDRAQF
jgi:hypothetical protein